MRSRCGDLNPKPADYKSAALPLSYTGPRRGIQPGDCSAPARPWWPILPSPPDRAPAFLTIVATGIAFMEESPLASAALAPSRSALSSQSIRSQISSFLQLAHRTDRLPSGHPDYCRVLAPMPRPDGDRNLRGRRHRPNHGPHQRLVDVFSFAVVPAVTAEQGIEIAKRIA
jgi:hypothetical protein